jgi:hypothetical protein
MTKLLPRAQRLPAEREPVRLRESSPSSPSGRAVGPHRPQIIDCECEQAPSMGSLTRFDGGATYPFRSWGELALSRFREEPWREPEREPEPEKVHAEEPRSLDYDLAKDALKFGAAGGAVFFALTIVGMVLVLMFGALISGGPPVYRDRGYSRGYSSYSNYD